MLTRLAVLFVALLSAAGGMSSTEVESAEPRGARDAEAKLDYFESHIRPALIEHCQECHSNATEASGGLLLDSRSGWEAGGDSGAAIVPGQSSQSRLLAAISYEDPNLQMPPDEKLPQSIYDAFSKWIDDGAVDPRQAAAPAPRSQTGLPVARAKDHWAYRVLTNVQLPVDGDHSATSPIDLFINLRLQNAGLTAEPAADPATLARRLSFDLTGLPPAFDRAQPSAHYSSHNARAANERESYRQKVDSLLASPHFGEVFARHWMDVARYAESITLRGFVLPEAWRYRDYLVQAFAEDRPFNQMICEQIAGDLLQSENLRERHMQLTATSFLAIGNTNLEQQDKSQLEMDYVDEQLEVIGRAFLGQTIGCARCHDHKFDPIPTRDYYALAGILRSAVALRHANLSQWIEQPLPLPEAEASHFDRLSVELADVKQRIVALKKRTSQKLASESRAIPVSELAGVVIDNRDAELVGQWVDSKSVGRFIGDGYIHDGDTEKGKKTATFEPRRLPPGQYQVRLAYSASPNRASNAVVRVFSADGEVTVTVDQRQTPPDEALWTSLGEYRFEANGQAFVLVSNEHTDGHVLADAVQFLPLDKHPQSAASQPAVGNQSTGRKEEALMIAELRELESQQKRLEQAIEQRPKYLTIVEESPPVDLPIHIRGDVHNVGDTVPRGFLTAIDCSWHDKISASSSGRLELARWLSSDRNPLTARVYANRIWCWLMGQGLVSSINNFGTTGTAPSHPELLDWLASELIRSGWSTKHLVRQIVLSDAYRRRLADPGHWRNEIDPVNRLYWRGHSRRLTAESLRDAMLQASGELNLVMGGSSIRPDTKADYDYPHASTRRSLYHPVFRNSLAPLLEAFDFADPSVSTGQRPRSTVATQALVLLNHPWVSDRAAATAAIFRARFGEDPERLVVEAYSQCLHRQPTQQEHLASVQFLQSSDPSREHDALQLLFHSLFASLDFRYLD